MLADIFGPDLLIVAIVLVVVLFGGAAIPKLARNLGSAKNKFEKGLGEAKKDSSAAASATGTVAASNGTAAAADTAAPSATPKADDSAPGNCPRRPGARPPHTESTESPDRGIVSQDARTRADRLWRGEVSTATMHPVDH